MDDKAVERTIKNGVRGRRFIELNKRRVIYG
jgi:hypothetical protein